MHAFFGVYVCVCVLGGGGGYSIHYVSAVVN